MIFLGCLFDRMQEKELQSLSKVGISNAVNTFQWALINGLNQHMDIPVSIYNVLPVGVFPNQYKKLILPTKHWSYKGSKNIEIGCVNLPFIKQYMRFSMIKRLLKQTTDKQILIYSTYLPFLKAIQKLDSNYHITLVVTDLPEFYDLGKTFILQKWFRNWNNLKIAESLKRVDAFVLLTEKMKEPLHVKNRPYVVVEGIYSADINLPPHPSSVKKIILYTGTLHYRFGISTLLKAFSQIDDPSYELWICGAGEAESEIRICTLKDARIRFYGYVSKEEALHLQQQATVLVNPRTNEGEYTKYSFPSKTIEYMTSGVPILMYKLDGIPSDYDPYLFYVEDNSTETLCSRLQDICEMPEKERKQFGTAAHDFVMREKNCGMQAKKIISMMEML